jgi:cysteine/glycine-rich protein
VEAMATFAGTTQKFTACEKTVYLVDKLAADNRVYHKACFRCHHCRGTLKVTLAYEYTYFCFAWLTRKRLGKGRRKEFIIIIFLHGSCTFFPIFYASTLNPCFLHLQLSNYCSFEGVLYCRPHYDQLFKRTGSLDKSFEGQIFPSGFEYIIFHLSTLPYYDTKFVLLSSIYSFRNTQNLET